MALLVLQGRSWNTSYQEALERIRAQKNFIIKGKKVNVQGCEGICLHGWKKITVSSNVVQRNVSEGRVAELCNNSREKREGHQTGG